MLQSPIQHIDYSTSDIKSTDIKVIVPVIPCTTNNTIPSTPKPTGDVKIQPLNDTFHNDVKKKIEKRTSNRLSSSLSMIQSNVSSASPPSTPSTPSITPQPFFNSARNHSFSSSQHSLQSTVSDQLLDHSHLKPGQNASLLSYSKTINMYRENAKKTNNMEIQCDFAIFLVEAAKRLLLVQQQKFPSSSSNSSTVTTEEDVNSQQQQAYLLEAEKLLKQIAMRGHSESQYYLANMYAAGLLNKTGKPDFDKSFPLFVQSAKHHHPDAAYR
jgi:hypothetical protein